MAVVGLAITILGFLLAAASVGLMASTSGRLVLMLAGILISLSGSIAVINPACQKNAVRKK